MTDKFTKAADPEVIEILKGRIDVIYEMTDKKIRELQEENKKLKEEIPLELRRDNHIKKLQKEIGALKDSILGQHRVEKSLREENERVRKEMPLKLRMDDDHTKQMMEIGEHVYSIAGHIFAECGREDDFCYQGSGNVFGGWNRLVLTGQGWRADGHHCGADFLKAFAEHFATVKLNNKVNA